MEEVCISILIFLAVVHYDQLLGGACTRKLVQTLFKPFLFILNLFQPEIKKKCVFSIFDYSSKLLDMQTLVDSLRGYLEFVFLGFIFYF